MESVDRFMCSLDGDYRDAFLYIFQCYGMDQQHALEVAKELVLRTESPQEVIHFIRHVLSFRDGKVDRINFDADYDLESVRSLVDLFMIPLIEELEEDFYLAFIQIFQTYKFDSYKDLLFELIMISESIEELIPILENRIR